MTNRRLTLFARALTLRCPHCGHRGVFQHWFRMNDVCRHCGISLATGNSVGANLLNLVVAEAMLVVLLTTLIVRTWPTPPWTLLQYAAPVLMLVSPLVFFPFSRVLFVAIDLAMHPAARPDLRVHGIDDTPG